MPPLFTAVAHAQGLAKVDSLIGRIVDSLVIPGVTLLTALAVVYFLYGVFTFIKNSGDSDEAVTTGKRHIIWGIIGLFIMVSAWGIIGFICTTVSCDSSGTTGEQIKQVDLCIGDNC